MSTKALSYMGAVRANVRQVAIEVEAAARRAGHDIKVIWGYNPGSRPEHSAGTALDFMVYKDRKAGDWIANYLWTHRARLGLRWQIWYQRIQSTSPGKGNAWRGMANRGNDTVNHKDHVHANFTVKSYVGPAAGAGGAGSGSSKPKPSKPKPGQKVDKWVVTAGSLYYRSQPLPGGRNRGTVRKNRVLDIVESKVITRNGKREGWIKTRYGNWLCAYSGSSTYAKRK